MSEKHKFSISLKVLGNTDIWTQKMENSQQHSKSAYESWYDKHYKKLLIIPAIILVFSIFYLVGFFQKNGDLIYKDVSLTGGTSVTVFDKNVDGKQIVDSLRIEFPDMQYRFVSDFND